MREPIKRRRGKLEPIGKVLTKVYPAPDQLEAAKAFAWWSRAVPARILAHARPVAVVHGILIVHVSSSVWANELHYLSEDLLEQLHQHAPHVAVTKLKFKVGPLPDLPRRHEPKLPEPAPVELAALPEDLGRALGRIHDDAVRQAVTRAATTSLGRFKK